MTATLWAVSAALLAASPDPPGLVADPPTVIPPVDFVEYWAAARVHVRGGDPYDGVQLLPHQREASGKWWMTQAVMLWTPPWTLPLYTPFGLLDPRAAHLTWLAVQLLCVLGSAALLWHVYHPGGFGAGRARAGWAAVVALIAGTFAPVWWLVGYGQNTGLVLLGLAGFLALRPRYPAAAGAVAALTAVKPHLLALFGLALVLDAATRDGRRALFGGVAALVALSVLAVLPDPDVFGEFAAALRRPHSHESPSMSEWQLPLASFHLRMATTPDRFAIQFVPVAVGMLALVPYWGARRRTWDWAAEAPRLVLASVLLAPYGGWAFDLVVLLVPVVATFARASATRRHVPITAAWAGHLAIFPFAAVIRYLHEGWWLAPAVCAWSLAVAVLVRAGSGPPSAGTTST